MEGQGLEGLIEYQHVNYERIEFPDAPRISGEDIIQHGGVRIFYFWSVSPTANLVAVIIPGILVQERHRTDSNGNVYSLVKPVSDEAKPNLEVAIWDEFIKKPGAIRLSITVFEKLKFDYWTQSDAPERLGFQSPIFPQAPAS